MFSRISIISLFIVFKHCSGDDGFTFGSDYSLIYNYIDPWKDFWLNIKELCRLTKYASMFEYEKNDATDNNLAMDGFRSFLIQYLYETETLPLVSFTTNDKKSMTSPTGKQIIFMMFESLEQLQVSWRDEKLTIYENLKRSYYMIFIGAERFQDVDCDDDDFITILKHKSGQCFDDLWLKLRIIEVTIVFPRICSAEYILKYDFIETFGGDDYAKGVTIVTKEHFDNDSMILLHNYSNFKRYPITLNMFERSPTYVKKMPPSSREAYAKDVSDIGDVGGLDGYGMANMVNGLNFTPILLRPSDNAEYGYKQANGSFTGSIGDIISKKMDISLNARFIKLYGTDDLEFTSPVFYDQFCVLAPKAQQIPSWMSIFLVFSIPVWATVGVTCLIFGVVWWYMKTKYPDDIPKPTSTVQCFYFLDMLLVMTSAPLIPLPTIHRERMFVTVCLIFNLVFAGLFQGYLSTAYSTQSFLPDIDTLEALDNSQISISTKNSDIFGANISRIGQSLTQKIVTNTVNSMKVAAFERKTAIVERRSDARFMINLNFTSRDGTPLLHIVNECPRSYHLAYIVYKGYPLLPHINRFFQKTVEAGLNDKWYFDTEFSILLKNRQKEEASDSTKKLSLVDVQTSFFFLIYGLIISAIVFICELMMFYSQKKKRKHEPFTSIRTNEQFIYKDNDTPRFPFIM